MVWIWLFWELLQMSHFLELLRALSYIWESRWLSSSLVLRTGFCSDLNALLFMSVVFSTRHFVHHFNVVPINEVVLIHCMICYWPLNDLVNLREFGDCPTSVLFSVMQRFSSLPVFPLYLWENRGHVTVYTVSCCPKTFLFLQVY